MCCPGVCSQAVCDLLPRLARKEADRLIAEMQDAQYRLEMTPTSTIDYVEALTFLDKIQARVRLISSGLVSAAAAAATLSSLVSIAEYVSECPPTRRSTRSSARRMW